MEEDKDLKELKELKIKKINKLRFEEGGNTHVNAKKSKTS